MPARYFFSWYYWPLIEIKDFKVLIHNKRFFDQLVKNKQEVHEKHVEMSRSDDYTTGNLLDYLYHQKYYKLIDTDKARHSLIYWQTNTAVPP